MAKSIEAVFVFVFSEVKKLQILCQNTGPRMTKIQVLSHRFFFLHTT